MNRSKADSAARSRSPFCNSDQSLGYQQNITGRRLAILVLPTTSWPRIREHSEEIVVAVVTLQPGQFRELTW